MGEKEKGLIKELREAGFRFRDVNHLFRQNNYLPIVAVNIILKWLPEIYNEHLGTGDCLAKSLMVETDQYDPSVLIDLFENSDHNEVIKCGIASVLSITNTTNIREWLLSQLLNKEHSFGKAGLLDGIVLKGEFKTKEDLKAFLIKIFDKYSFYETFQKLIQKYFTVDDIEFIQKKAMEADSATKKRQLLKVAEKIRTRKRIPKFP